MSTDVKVGKQDIIDGLEKLGLKNGDTVLVHSSLKSFGFVDGGADTIIDGILETVLPEGNAMFPTLTGNENLNKDNPPIFNPMQDSCWTGKIPEVFRLRKGSIRSWHPTHSVAVIGNDAQYLTSCHHVCFTPCGYNSPYDKLVKMNGYILMMGADLESTTHFHYVEELVHSPYHLQDDVVEAKIQHDGTEEIVSIKIHKYGVERRFMKAEQYLIENKALIIGKIGNSTIRLIKAKLFTQLMVDVLKKNPDFLLDN